MKHLLSLLALVITINSFGQLDKKYWLVGGNGSFFSYNGNFTTTGQPTVSGKLTEINLSANVGYFLFDKFAAGLRPCFTSIKSRGGNSTSVYTEDIALYAGPFIRYYFLNKENLFNVLIDGAYQFGSLKNFGKGSVQNASIMTGSELFFNSSVGIELLIGYLYHKRTIDNTQPGYTYFKKGFHASVGFQLHLSKN